MTRVAILSDIHGNLPALEAVLSDLAQFDVDHIVAAGDVVNWGPLSVPVLERLAEVGCQFIRGNNEYYLLDYQTPREPTRWAEYVMLPWLYGQLKGRWHARIAAWPDAVRLLYPDAPPAYVTHGWPGNPWTGIYSADFTPDAEIEEKLACVQETTFVTAHTHLPLERRVAGKHILNTGTVGVPLEGELTATYLILEAAGDCWDAIFRRVPLDAAPVLDAFEQAGFVDAVGPEGLLVIEEFKIARLQLHTFHRWRSAQRPGVPVSFDLVAEFLDLDEQAVINHTYPPYCWSPNGARLS
jgi:predicted phosphodiesterase